MKALAIHQYGPPGPRELGDVAIPHAGPGQIQVRIAAASINPLDLRLPRGDFPHLPVTFPHVPGNDFAGTVTEVGDGVTAYRIGDEVFGHAVPHALRAMAGAERPSLTTGTLAEFAVFEADTPFIAHRPATLDVVQAAALPTVGITALALLATARIQPHETVLVVGATGGVGTTVLPLLAKVAKRVVATARPEDADLLRNSGAETIDYGDYPEDVDVAFNLVLPSDELNEVAHSLKTGGRLLHDHVPEAGEGLHRPGRHHVRAGSRHGRRPRRDARGRRIGPGRDDRPALPVRAGRPGHRRLREPAHHREASRPRRVTRRPGRHRRP